MALKAQLAFEESRKMDAEFWVGSWFSGCPSDLGQLVGGTVSPVAVAGGQGGGARVSEGGGWEG